MDANRRHALARTPWKTRTSREVYENPWMRLREDVAEMPDGRTTIYGVVQCKPAVGVLPFLDDDTVVLVGQYRYVFGEFRWEMPTGGAHPGESLEAAAQRELAEEAGFEAADLVKLCDFHTSKSIVRGGRPHLPGARASGRPGARPTPRSSSRCGRFPSWRPCRWCSAARSRTP